MEQTKDDPDDYCTCKACGDHYELREGCDPTPYCDLCAHKVIERLEKQLTELKALPMPLPADPTNPFYIETMEQAKVLKEMATRTGLHKGNQLETIARKLEYMAQAFTCTANFVPLQLKLASCEADRRLIDHLESLVFKNREGEYELNFDFTYPTLRKAYAALAQSQHQP